MKEVKRDLNEWKDIPCLCIGRLIIIKAVALTKLMYGFNSIPTKIKAAFFFFSFSLFLFAETVKLIIKKIIWLCKEPLIAKII